MIDTLYPGLCLKLTTNMFNHVFLYRMDEVNTDGCRYHFARIERDGEPVDKIKWDVSFHSDCSRFTKKQPDYNITEISEGEFLAYFL